MGKLRSWLRKLIVGETIGERIRRALSEGVADGCKLGLENWERLSEQMKDTEERGLDG